METTVKMLDRLTVLEDKRYTIIADVDAKIALIEAQALPLKEERATLTADVDAEIGELTKAVKQAVILGGATVKATWLQCVYTKPRVTWDTKGLGGFMVAHPEIEAFRKVGKASASIRIIKQV